MTARAAPAIWPYPHRTVAEVDAANPSAVQPAPEGWAESAKIMTFSELCRAYGVGSTRATRWCKELGVTARRAARPSARPKAPAPLVRRPTTDAEFAADFLRRYGPVHRCNAKGIYSPTGDHYSRNGYVLTGDDVVARAMRLGWRSPDMPMAA